MFTGYLLPFFERKPYRLVGLSTSTEQGFNYVSFTNVSDDFWAVCFMAESGLGSIAELKELDTPDFLDALEYLQIKNKINEHISKKNNN